MPPIEQTSHSRRSADQERLDLALASAEIGTWDWNLQTGQITWGENFERMHGFEPGAFGSSLETYQRNIHPDDRERVANALRICAEGGPDYAAEYRLVTPDGSIHYVEAHGRMLIGEDHTRLIGVCTDISDRVKLLENEREARRDAETSELHYRTLAETIPQQVWTARPDGGLDFVNQRVTEYFGRTAEDVVGSGWKDVVHPADLSTVVERWAHSLSSGDEYEVEFRLRRHDGRYRWYLGRAIPVRDPNGTIVRWLGTNTDIDEKKRSLGLMATQISVAQLLVNARTLSEVGGAILASVCRNLGWTCAQLWVVNRASGLLDLSNSWCGSDLARCDLERLGTFNRMERGVGLPGRIWSSKEPAWIEDVQIDPNFPRAALLRNIGLRSAFGFPMIVGGEVSAILELFSNEYRPIEESTIATTATFGNQIGQFIERQAAEEARNAALIQLERLQSVTDAALSHLSLGDLLDKLLAKISSFVSSDIALVLLVDPEKNELYPAATFGSAVELPRDFRITVGESFSGRVAAERKTRTIRQATQQDLVRPEMRALGIDSLMAVPLTLQEKLIGVLMVGSVRDREFQRDEIEFAELVAARLAIAIENSSLYEDAREANRVKDRFISIASHELKTPMTGILGWTAILRTETDPEVIAEAVKWIEQSARTQARLIEDFLDLTRIREGKLVLREEAVDLQSVVRRTLTIMNPVAAQRGVVLESSIPERPAPVFGDPARLQQVVTNLLSNAIKFTPPGKCVRTAIDMEASTAAIIVTDEGAGISAEFLPNIFNAFEQDENGIKAGGLGLGLHIVSTIVKMHGGTIEARSAGPGTGSTFIVRLPMTVAPVAR